MISEPSFVGPCVYLVTCVPFPALTKRWKQASRRSSPLPVTLSTT